MAVHVALTCGPRITARIRGYGQPDDLAVLGGHLLFGDLKTGVVAEVSGGRARVLVRHLDVPEGIAVTGAQQIVVVEQGLNRLVAIDLHRHSRRVLLRLANTTGNEGVDGIARIHGDFIIPDSPYGTILRFRNGKPSTLASGLTRPTDAVGYDGGLAIADEYANAVWLVKNGVVSRLATLSTPDDVAVVHGMLVAVTLGDGGLWEVRPRVTRLMSGFNQPQGLVTTGAHSIAIAASNQNTIFEMSIPAACG
ncbi:MAG TPA: hypothetical protein VG815_01630 [Chloroflexota bacterium]|nr:hypothetical protein [Chloroflexota bacterium]